VKFIHAADLHIDSPLRGLDAYQGAPVDRLRGASRRALIALVDLAIEQEVDFVLLAGDIYDGNWADFRTGLFFRDQMLRLHRAGIEVFIVKGNHDAESLITKQLPDIGGVHVFSSRRAETIHRENLGVALHGQSFPNRAVPEDLIRGYPKPIPGCFNIGLLHTSLNGREGHDTYAPTSVQVLCDKGYDYFALGHVHAREVIRERAPRIVFPGNLQGRHAKEVGPKGCELVSVERGVIVAAEFVPLDVVRWHQLRLDVTGISTLNELSEGFSSKAQELAGFLRDRLHAIRVVLEGESTLHKLEAQEPGTLGAAIQASTQDMDDCDIWVEQVHLGLSLPLDRQATAERTDAVGEVVRLVDSLATDDAMMTAWFAQQLADMKNMPTSLADASPSRLGLQEMRTYLAEAEATVFAQIAALRGERADS
jgi:exonuclease SbcD